MADSDWNVEEEEEDSEDDLVAGSVTTGDDDDVKAVPDEDERSDSPVLSRSAPLRHVEEDEEEDVASAMLAGSATTALSLFSRDISLAHCSLAIQWLEIRMRVKITAAVAVHHRWEDAELLIFLF